MWNLEDLLFERGIDICHEDTRMWWNRFGPMFAGDIRRPRVRRMRGFRHWRWHLDEKYVKLNGETVYLWRAVDHECEVLESYVTTGGLRFYGAAIDEPRSREDQEVGRWANNRVENSHLPLDDESGQC